MTKIIWTDEDRFSVGDLRFRCTHDYTATTTAEEIIILKRRPFIEFYVSLFQRERPAHLLEVGFFEGGSTLLWAALFPDMRITAIDLRKARPAVQRLAEAFGDRLQMHFDFSQTDAEALAALDTPNMVIDDASHQYALTRRTFELVFPRLAPGEKYVIEDWGWGHWPGWGEQWSDAPLLSNLVVELTVAAASSAQWIAGVQTDARSCTVTRGPAQGDFSLDALWAKRGRDITQPLPA